MRKSITASVAGLWLLAIGAPAEAGLVTSIPGGTAWPMPSLNYFGTGPQTFGDGIVWSSTDANAVFGYTGGYGYASNGYWNGGLGPMAGLNDVTDSMTFAFTTPVAGVGGFMNYAPVTSNPTTIAAYNSAHSLIESYNLTFTASNQANTGEFLGFLESSADIKYFTLIGNYIGITDLTTTTTAPAVPEPATLGLLGAGLLGLLTVRGRRDR